MRDDQVIHEEEVELDQWGRPVKMQQGWKNNFYKFIDSKYYWIMLRFAQNYSIFCSTLNHKKNNFTPGGMSKKVGGKWQVDMGFVQARSRNVENVFVFKEKRFE